jgi:hypothetical protein
MGIGGLGMDSSRKLMLESRYEFVEFARDVCVYYLATRLRQIRENSEINGGNLRTPKKRSIVIVHCSTWNLGMAEITSAQINYHLS